MLCHQLVLRHLWDRLPKDLRKTAEYMRPIRTRARRLKTQNHQLLRLSNLRGEVLWQMVVWKEPINVTQYTIRISSTSITKYLESPTFRNQTLWKKISKSSNSWIRRVIYLRFLRIFHTKRRNQLTRIINSCFSPQVWKQQEQIRNFQVYIWTKAK